MAAVVAVLSPVESVVVGAWPVAMVSVVSLIAPDEPLASPAVSGVAESAHPIIAVMPARASTCGEMRMNAVGYHAAQAALTSMRAEPASMCRGWIAARWSARVRAAGQQPLRGPRHGSGWPSQKLLLSGHCKPRPSGQLVSHTMTHEGALAESTQ